jgi:uncharacterized protein (TIGR00369 family)
MRNDDPTFWDMVEGRSAGPPATAFLGARYRSIDVEAGTITIEFNPRVEFLNPARKIQGGFIAAMLDDTMGPIVYATLDRGEFNTTLEFKVSFMRSADLGPLVASARIIHRGRSIVFVEAELRDSAGALIASATSTMKIVRTETEFGSA